MAYNFGSLVFGPAVKALQERYGSRRQYARREQSAAAPDVLGPDETDFLAARDSFYMATVTAEGWPYVQHRGGPPGFLKVVDERTLAFADYRGNRQFVSAGNVSTNDRVALILVDYPHQARLKILGHAEVLEGDTAKQWIEKLADADYAAVAERIFIIHVAAFDWNCPQHISPRFTVPELREVLGPVEQRVETLQAENDALRAELAELRAA